MSKTAATKKAVTKAAAPTAAHYGVILAPVITEKATNGSQHNQVTFRVPVDADKRAVKVAVEAMRRGADGNVGFCALERRRHARAVRREARPFRTGAP